MEILANRLNRIEESETFEMSQKSNELKERGFDVINLTVGQPDFNTPDFIKEAAKKAIDENYSFYTPVQGYKDLINAIIQKLKRENSVEYNPNQIVVSNGAKQSLANVILSLLDKGDEILIPVPYWVTYQELGKLANGKCIFLNTSVENNFKVTAKQIKEAITDKTRILLYSSPCNPTGSVYTRDELRAIAEVISEYPNIYIISDEIYEHLNYIGKHESISQFDFIKNQLIIINGVSKAYAMTGWRIGYMAAPEWIAKACKKLQGHTTSNACSISQKAAEAALKHTGELFIEQTKILRERRDVLATALSEIPNIRFMIPDGTFYFFPEVSRYYGKTDGKVKITNSKSLAMYLLENAHVAVVSGSAFGSDECIRISFTVGCDKLKEAAKRIKDTLAKLY
jgi:aspartate aminotransferase